MKGKIEKVVFTIIAICLLFTTIMMRNTYAAEYSFSVSGPKTANIGDSVTISITGNGLTGMVNLSASGATLNSSSVWVEKNTVTATATITSLPATITATPQDLSDNEYNTVNVGAKLVTINANAPAPTPEPPKPTNTPSTPTPTPIPTRIPSESNNNNNNENNEPKSSNNYLKSLSVNVGKLIPAFNRENTNYTVEFDDGFDIKGLKSIKVSGQKENDKASVTGLGEKTLEEGENTIAIEVKAENGSVRTYNIKVVKPTSLKQSDLRIKSLEVTMINKENKFIKGTLNEEFSPDIFDYTLNVNKDITALDITPNLENNDIIVNIEGIDNLQPGENIVKITLTSKDDSNVKTVYTIKVNKEKEPEEVIKTDGEVTNKTPLAFLKGPKGILTIVIAIIVILVIALVTLIIIDNKNKKKMQVVDNEPSKKKKDDYNVFEDKEVKTKDTNKDDSKGTKGRGKRFN